MIQCQCREYKVLTGIKAEQYSKKKYIKEVQRAPGGWRYLLMCEICGSYWEMTWEGGGGFDDGVMTLRRLSFPQLKERWPRFESSQDRFP